MIFCTLFNWAYLPQGIALYRSLERNCKGNFVLHVLCIDDYTAVVLSALNLPKLRIVPLHEIEDEQLKAVRATRSIGEFCWTCTTPLLLHVVRQQSPDAIVSYLDADLFFYSDPAMVLQEMTGGSIYIHEHDFAPEYAHLLPTSGRFNVGLAAFRNNPEGLACLERWKAQCFRECTFDPAAGKCGDQNYLDEWPQLYPGLIVANNLGVGQAPWNISKHQLGSRSGEVTVDGHPAVFYHFHSLRLLRPRLGVKPVALVAGAYRINDDVVETLYKPYVRALWDAVGWINGTNAKSGLKHDFVMEFPTLPREYPKLLNAQLYFSFGGIRIPSAYNARLMSWLYGIDAEKSHL